MARLRKAKHSVELNSMIRQAKKKLKQAQKDQKAYNKKLRAEDVIPSEIKMDSSELKKLKEFYRIEYNKTDFNEIMDRELRRDEDIIDIIQNGKFKSAEKKMEKIEEYIYYMGLYIWTVYKTKNMELNTKWWMDFLKLEKDDARVSHLNDGIKQRKDLNNRHRVWTALQKEYSIF